MLPPFYGQAGAGRRLLLFIEHSSLGLQPYLGCPPKRGRIAIVRTDDNLADGSIVSVETAREEYLTAVTDRGIDQLRDMHLTARVSVAEWHHFLEDFVGEPDIRRTRQRSAIAAAVGRLPSIVRIARLSETAPHPNSRSFIPRPTRPVPQQALSTASARSDLRRAVPEWELRALASATRPVRGKPF